MHDPADRFFCAGLRVFGQCFSFEFPRNLESDRQPIGIFGTQPENQKGNHQMQKQDQTQKIAVKRICFGFENNILTVCKKQKNRINRHGKDQADN